MIIRKKTLYVCTCNKCKKEFTDSLKNTIFLNSFSDIKTLASFDGWFINGIHAYCPECRKTKIVNLLI